MARTAVAIISMNSAGSSVNPTLTTMDATNNHVITPDRAYRRLFLVAQNTFAGSKTVTLKAGAYPPASRKHLGDLTITLTQNQWVYQQIDGSRFAQADGTINVDLAAATTGTIGVFGLVRL